MLKKILVGLVAIIALFCLYASMQPATYSVTRSTTVNAAPEQVFAHVNDFHRWDAWSPWSKLDPAMTTTFSGPDAGVGAVYSWTGNSDVGSGSMTIIKSEPPTRVDINLAFITPMEGVSLTEFTFVPEGAGTKVTWTMSGKNNFMSKVISVFYDMEKMIGPSFEQGLSALKGVVETGKA